MQPDSKKPRLLIADDEPFNLDLLARIFEDEYDVDEANNGLMALEKIQEQEYDLVLLDIMMPKMDGLEVLRIVRRTKDIATQPIILVSAMSDKAHIAEGIQLGANDYITKPLDIDIARARVNNQLIMKHLIDEREHYIGQLQHVNEVRARMMQVASHDLKNPLSNLKMLSEIMRDEPDNAEQIRDLTEMMDNSINAMLNVIEDFLDNQFLEDDEIQISLNPVDTEPMIHQVVRQYAAAAHNKNINLYVNGITNASIQADEHRLQQVLSNLVSNAIKYSPKGSNVIISSEENSNRWRLRVIDQGPGIPEDEQRHLFQPFSKNKISTKPTGGESSTGLGLWIVKQMIELQHGRVGVEFPEEGGSVFWLELELA